VTVEESGKSSKLIESIDRSSEGSNSTGEIIDLSIDRSILVSDLTVEIFDSIDRSNSTVETINRRATGEINNRSIKSRDPSSQVES
jgi:hypothetical protein